MVGVCDIEYVDGRYSLLIPDTDSGRLEPNEEGGRPGFSPPGGAELWLFDILNIIPQFLLRFLLIMISLPSTYCSLIFTVDFRRIWDNKDDNNDDQ